MKDNKYDGVPSHYAAKYVAVVGANLIQQESLIIGEDERKKILGIASTTVPSQQLHSE